MKEIYTRGYACVCLCVFVVDMLNVYILCNNWRKIAMAMMVKDILYIVM